jgi:hypothetical protein
MLQSFSIILREVLNKEEYDKGYLGRRRAVVELKY